MVASHIWVPWVPQLFGYLRVWTRADCTGDIGIIYLDEFVDFLAIIFVHTAIEIVLIPIECRVDLGHEDFPGRVIRRLIFARVHTYSSLSSTKINQLQLLKIIKIRLNLIFFRPPSHGVLVE